ncbi:MAG: hypothetical protein MUC63_05145, partial [Planctomycetes bacterium]|nr:hypothetical protein [Planctomycetota bacterium]
SGRGKTPNPKFQTPMNSNPNSNDGSTPGTTGTTEDAEDTEGEAGKSSGDTRKSQISKKRLNLMPTEACLS